MCRVLAEACRLSGSKLSMMERSPLRDEAVAQIEFLNWTEGDRLRHSKFVGLRGDKHARNVVKEQP
jgi:ATP-dependent DNA ligase